MHRSAKRGNLTDSPIIREDPHKGLPWRDKSRDQAHEIKEEIEFQSGWCGETQDTFEAHHGGYTGGRMRETKDQPENGHEKI